MQRVDPGDGWVGKGKAIHVDGFVLPSHGLGQLAQLVGPWLAVQGELDATQVVQSLQDSDQVKRHGLRPAGKRRCRQRDGLELERLDDRSAGLGEQAVIGEDHGVATVAAEVKGPVGSVDQQQPSPHERFEHT